MIEATSRIDLLILALTCGGLYAAYRVVLTVCYPALSGMLWQHHIGPIVIRHWPTLGQSKDQHRPSYIPQSPNHPYVRIWALLPAPIDDVTQGIRDGLLLGVLASLLPEIFSMYLVLWLVLLTVVAKHAWRLSRSCGADLTDRVFWAIKELLMFLGALWALHATSIL